MQKKNTLTFHNGLCLTRRFQRLISSVLEVIWISSQVFIVAYSLDTQGLITFISCINDVTTMVKLLHRTMNDEG